MDPKISPWLALAPWYGSTCTKVSQQLTIFTGYCISLRPFSDCIYDPCTPSCSVGIDYRDRYNVRFVSIELLCSECNASDFDPRGRLWGWRLPRLYTFNPVYA